jgi:hypothetical protein
MKAASFNRQTHPTPLNAGCIRAWVGGSTAVVEMNKKQSPIKHGNRIVHLLPLD